MKTFRLLSILKGGVCLYISVLKRMVKFPSKNLYINCVSLNGSLLYIIETQ